MWDVGAQKHHERVSEGLGHLSLPLQCLSKGITSPCGKHEALCPSLVWLIKETSLTQHRRGVM